MSLLLLWTLLCSVGRKMTATWSIGRFIIGNEWHYPSIYVPWVTLPFMLVISFVSVCFRKYMHRFATFAKMASSNMHWNGWPGGWTNIRVELSWMCWHHAAKSMSDKKGKNVYTVWCYFYTELSHLILCFMIFDTAGINLYSVM